MYEEYFLRFDFYKFSSLLFIMYTRIYRELNFIVDNFPSTTHMHWYERENEENATVGKFSEKRGKFTAPRSMSFWHSFYHNVEIID